MTDPTSDTGVENTAQGATIRMPSGRDIYDALMGRIELDLVSTSIPTLDAKYAGETPEQRTARFQRYEAAYARYAEVYKAWVADTTKLVHAYRREALQIQETQSREQEQGILTELEQQFQFADSADSFPQAA